MLTAKNTIHCNIPLCYYLLGKSDMKYPIPMTQDGDERRDSRGRHGMVDPV